MRKKGYKAKVTHKHNCTNSQQNISKRINHMWSLFQHSEAKVRSPLRTRWRVCAPSLSFGAAKASSDREGRPSRRGPGLWGHSTLGSMSFFFLYFLALILKQPQPRKTRELRPRKARPAPCSGSAWKGRQRLPCTNHVDPPGKSMWGEFRGVGRRKEFLNSVH